MINNNVFVNLTNKLLNIGLTQTFPSMLPRLSFEPTFGKINAHFFSKLFHLILKNSYFEFVIKIKQKRSYQAFAKIFQWKVQKPVVFGIFEYKYSNESQKRSYEVLHTNYAGYEKSSFISLKSLWGDRFLFWFMSTCFANASKSLCIQNSFDKIFMQVEG